jgi:hypothetical protein
MQPAPDRDRIRRTILHRLRKEFTECLLDALMGGACRTIRVLLTIANGCIIHSRVADEDAVDRESKGIADCDAVQMAIQVTTDAFRILDAKLDTAAVADWFGDVSVEAFISNGRQQQLYVRAERMTKYLDYWQAKKW